MCRDEIDLELPLHALGAIFHIDPILVKAFHIATYGDVISKQTWPLPAIVSLLLHDCVL